MGPRFFRLGAFLLLALLLLPGTRTFAAGAALPNTALILATTVSGGASSLEYQAAVAAGMNVELATPTDWLAKTTADFKTYRAIIFGDPMCGELAADPGLLAAAEATTAIWGPAIDGNILIVGTDPAFHYSYGFATAQTLAYNGISYAGSATGRTGAYICLSCYYNRLGPSNVVPLLTYFGTFTVSDNPPCADDIHIVDPSHPAMAGLTDLGLSNWVCSAHELFRTYPTDFSPLLIAEGFTSPDWTPTYTAPDGHTGAPFVMTHVPTCGPAPIIAATTTGSPTATPSTMWPPNHQYVDIVVTGITVTGTGTVVRTITCNETPTGPPTPLYIDGVDPFHFKLLSERNGSGSGRVYTITYTCQDACGTGVGSVSVQVTVVHDQRNKTK